MLRPMLFHLTFLPLLLLTSCRFPAEFSADSSHNDSDINKASVPYKEQISQYETADEKISRETENKEKELPEKNPQSYIGLNYPPLPNDLESRGGWLVGEISGALIYSVKEISQGEKRMLWLNIASPTRQGQATFKVKDVLSLPSFDDDSEIVTGGSDECSVNGKPDPNLIVLAKLEDADTQYLTKIRKAWQVDQTVGKFKGLSLEGIQIKCQNVNYGI